MTAEDGRSTEYPIDTMFLDRWSPRSFTAEAIAESELLTMLDAARWAASCYNIQPWRFIYALRDTPAWAKHLDLLVPFNQLWAKDASALVFFVSNSIMRMPGAETDSPSSTLAQPRATWHCRHANLVGSPTEWEASTGSER